MGDSSVGWAYHERDRNVQNDLEEDVLARFNDKPSTSTQPVAQELNVGQSTVWKIVQENLCHPCEIKKVQAISPADFHIREAFCEWFLKQHVHQFQERFLVNWAGIVQYVQCLSP
ncbi:hypothetical protein J6590_061161 [Homalodisca vitripennis]|nr:hypothetical protein J6590_061161 [Homalodisca vitripennis]